MSELFKAGCPRRLWDCTAAGYAIQQEIRSGKLVVLNRDELVIPIQAYAYRMNTRMNPVAERFWRELRELEIVLS